MSHLLYNNIIDHESEEIIIIYQLCFTRNVTLHLPAPTYKTKELIRRIVI